MEWFDFYDRYYDLSDKSLKIIISNLEDIGPGDEVANVVVDIDDPNIKDLLIKKAMELDAEFTEDDFYHLDGEISTDLYVKLALKGNLVLSDNDGVSQVLASIFDEEGAEALYKRAIASGIKFTQEQLEWIGRAEDVDDEEEYGSDTYNSGGIGFFDALLGIAATLGDTTSSKKKHNGRCNGDCANCPPHYGYRYGRWYYGHGHNHGCEFGGNKGGGGPD